MNPDRALDWARATRSVSVSPSPAGGVRGAFESRSDEPANAVAHAGASAGIGQGRGSGHGAVTCDDLVRRGAMSVSLAPLARTLSRATRPMAFDAFALILAMLLLGMVLRRLGVFEESAAEVLNRVVLYVCLPAAVLRYAPQLEFRLELLGVIAVPWLMLLATLGLVSLATRWLRLRRDQHAVLLLTVALGNTSFLGYPLIRALAGDDALPYAVLYDQFGSFILLSTFGLFVLARYSGDAPPSARVMLLRILRFPPLLALVFGLTLMPADPPSWIDGGLQRLTDALLPLVMLAMGITIRLRLARGERLPLLIGLSLKLLLLPLLALALAPLLGLEGLARQAAVLEAAMPPMITAAALAISHRLAPRLAAAMVGYGILFSMLTLPLWAWLLRGAA